MSFKTTFVSDTSTVKTMPSPAERTGPSKYAAVLDQVKALKVGQGLKVTPEEGTSPKDLRNRLNGLRRQAKEWLDSLDAHLSIKLIPDEHAVLVGVAEGRSQPRPRKAEAAPAAEAAEGAES